MERKVLVIGGTGMIGIPVVQALDNSGFKVYLMSRGKLLPEVLLERENLTFLRGDVTNLSDLRKVIASIKQLEFVYFHPPAYTGSQRSKSVDVEGTKNLISALPHLVHFVKLSEIDVDEDNRFVHICEKFESEQLIQNHWKNWTILRPTWFMESIPKHLITGSIGISILSNKIPIWWIAGKDYAQAVVATMKHPEISSTKIYNIQGPEALSMIKAIRLFNQFSRMGKRTIYLPSSYFRLMAFFNSEYIFLSQLVEFYKSRIPIFKSALTNLELHKPVITLHNFAKNFIKVK